MATANGWVFIGFGFYNITVFERFSICTYHWCEPKSVWNPSNTIHKTLFYKTLIMYPLASRANFLTCQYQTSFLNGPPIELLHTKLHTYILLRKKKTKQKTLLHAMLAIIFLIVFVTHFQLLLIQMPLRCVFLSEHNKSSYLPPAPTFFILPVLLF